MSPLMILLTLLVATLRLLEDVPKARRRRVCSCWRGRSTEVKGSEKV